MLKKAVLLFILSYLPFDSYSSQANFINEQIDAFFNQQLTNIADNITINHLNQNVKLDCANPALSLANKNKFWGEVMIVAQCNDKKTFIKLHVAATGNYIVASQPISAGQRISIENTRVQSGRLDTLPQGVVFSMEDVNNYIALRNINSDQPIKSSMIRKAWKVKAGQSVKVILIGEGYQIETQGKALTNAALGDRVNVRINSVKIIEGIASEQGVTIFDKKN